MADERAPLRIRKASADDQDALGRLGGILVRAHHAFEPARFLIFDPVEPGYGRFLVSVIDDPRGFVTVAEDPELGVVGYVFARIESKDWSRLLEAHGKIHDVAVDERAQRRGVARTLLVDAIDRLKALGATRLVAETAAKNERAKALFASLGFGPTMIEQFKSVD